MAGTAWRPRLDEGVAQQLRESVPAVLGRIEEDRLLLDPRTVFSEEDLSLLDAVKRSLSGGDR